MIEISGRELRVGDVIKAFRWEPSPGRPTCWIDSPPHVVTAIDGRAVRVNWHDAADSSSQNWHMWSEGEIRVHVERAGEIAIDRSVAVPPTVRDTWALDANSGDLRAVFGDVGCAEDLACTAVVQAPVDPRGDRPDLARRVTDTVGTQYSARTYSAAGGWLNLEITCCSCGFVISSGMSALPMAERADYLAACVLKCREPGAYEEGDCRCVDGLTPERCLERYIADQRADRAPPPKSTYVDEHGARWWVIAFDYGEPQRLTPRQLDLARSEWSAALRARIAETKERERNEVMCERDEDGL